jgi:hypothetical protein
VPVEEAFDVLSLGMEADDRFLGGIDGTVPNQIRARDQSRPRSDIIGSDSHALLP